ncbi:d5a7673f-60c4-426a-98e2-a6876cffb5f7-CDS [Sclerotinia trifoliorum]|uniref:D5a7673f-60c4-426a-98e2-a6876cffb5f7-CDS n=1 Tax=Sclerotinia trifoliorum TaxID=28548 RepID=A0A8H2VUK3_9HELO|nr:d5a7673f-60c4-426a-98e2-a6876cffb5f7-CDS [Sclerotinia trifoliorum]
MSIISRPSRTLMRPSSSSKLPKAFSQLPPSFRSFHASPQPRSLDSVLIATHGVLEGLHSFTGLPWAYTLPLTALAIRTILILPIGINSRRAAQKQMDLMPLMNAWQHQFRKQSIQEVGHLGPDAANQFVKDKMKKKKKELYSRYSCGTWKHYLPFVQLPIWMVAVETIRKMCGAHDGLLKWIESLFISTNANESVATTDLDLGSLLLEPSFATEGALWFPNLLISDPMLILPFMLSGSILLNLSGQGRPKTVFMRRLMNSLKIVALAIIPLTLQMPSAMLVYWTSSSLLAYGQAKILDVLMPIRKPAVPCKGGQPVRYAGTRES